MQTHPQGYKENTEKTRHNLIELSAIVQNIKDHSILGLKASHFTLMILMLISDIEVRRQHTFFVASCEKAIYTHL